MADSVETFLDEVCKVMAVSDGGLGSVRSFLVFGVNQMPESITPEMVPCAISYVTDMQVQYSEGGPTIFYWSGQTDFHLTRDVKVANVPMIMKYYGRIFAACAQKTTLNSTVELFTILQNTANAMQFVTYKHPVTNADDHQGIVAHWTVKQKVSGQYTISV